MMVIPYLSAARFAGDEAAAFLQAQLTADIGALEDGAATFACYCTPKGQVLGLLRVQRNGDGFLVAAASKLLPGILKRLGMFVFRTRVTFEAATDLVVCGLPGPAYAFVPADGAPAVPDEAAASAWKAGELRAGVAWLAPGSAEKFIPQMLGFDALGALSFTKGCYPGQEIVARARYLGKVKRAPLVVEVEGGVAPVAGERVRLLRGADWHDAVVVDSAATGTGTTVVFTVARTEPDDAPVEIGIGEDRYRCATT